MENNENIAYSKKKPSYGCLIAFGASILALVFSALCFLLGIGGLLIPSIVFVVASILLALWATSAAEKRDEAFELFGVVSFFVSAPAVLFTILAICL